MILARRILPFIVPLFVGVLVFGILLQPAEWRVWILILFAALLLSMAYMVEWSLQVWRRAEFWGLLFPIAAFIAGGIGFLLFVEQDFYQYTIVGVMVLATGVYFENVFTYRFQPQKYGHLSLPNQSGFLLAISGFAIFSAGFGLLLTNLITSWQLAIFAAVFTLLLMIHTVWSYSIRREWRVIAIGIPTILMTELVWVIHYWPTAYFVNGAVIAVMLYIVPTIVQLRLRQVLNARLLWQYGIISGVSILAIILTAQWR